MMLWFKRHRRLQERLSAYMDGELAERDARSLETHLESCESCSRELAGLRVTAAAMRELSDMDAPRTFALTAADVARPARWAKTGMAHSLNSGLRLTGAGLAAVLALVLVLDVSGVVGGGDAGDSGDQSGGLQMLGLPADATQEEAKAAGDPDALDSAPLESLTDDSQATPAPGGERADLATPTPVLGYASSGGISGDAGVGGPSPVMAETPAATEQPLPATGGEVTPPVEAGRIASAEATATPTASPQPGADEAYGLNDYPEGDTETLSVSDSNVDSDDGPSALLVIEVVLAVLAGVSVAGTIAATYAERRRR